MSLGNFNIKGIVKFPAVIKSDCVVFAYAFRQGRQTIVECYEENLSCINDVLHSEHDTMSKLHFYNLLTVKPCCNVLNVVMYFS
jgi:hypothetical protein